MAVLADLRDTVKLRANVQTREPLSDTTIENLVTQAIREHNSVLTVATLPVEEEEAIIILSQAKVQLIRASAASREESNSGGGQGSTDRDSKYYKCTNLYSRLMEIYQGIVERQNLSAGTGVVVSDLIVHDAILGQDVPGLETEKPSFTVTLALHSTSSAVTVDDGEYVLEWSLNELEDFDEYLLYHITGANEIREHWNYNSATGIPEINPSATKLITLTDPRTKVVKTLSMVKVSITNRFLLVVRTKANITYYSNELELISP